MTDSMIDYTTIFESTRNLPKNIVLGHGENADLVAAFTDNGVGVALSGFSARAIYQPKSKWGTDEWFECPCDISGDTAVAHWGNTYDNGENAVRMFLQLSKGGTVAYPAIYHIRLFDTPGFAPNPLTPIPETIDFSQYTVQNAPWPSEDELENLETAVEGLSDRVDEISAYIPLSGDVMIAGNLSTDYNIFHREVRTVTWKNIELQNDMEIHYSGDIVFSYMADNAADLLLLTSKDIPVKVSGTSLSSGEVETFDGVLKNPEYWSYYQEFAIKWNIYKDENLIGNIIFFKAVDSELPQTHSAQVYEDYFLLGTYVEDTTSEVEDIADYIYDSDKLNKEIAEIRTQITENAYYHVIRYEHDDGGFTVYGKNKTITSVTILSGASSMDLEIPVESEPNNSDVVIDFIIDIRNTLDSDFPVNITPGRIVWKLAFDDGMALNDFTTVAPGATVRYYFTQTGFTVKKTWQGQLLDVPVIHLSKKEIVFNED